MGDLFVAFRPAIQYLQIAAVGDGAVDRSLHRVHQAVAFLQRDGDVGGLRPAAGHDADQPGFAGQPRLVSAGDVGPEGGVGAAGLDRQRGGRIVGHVDRLEGFEPLLPILLVPCQQDGFLIGVGADDNF